MNCGRKEARSFAVEFVDFQLCPVLSDQSSHTLHFPAIIIADNHERLVPPTRNVLLAFLTIDRLI